MSVPAPRLAPVERPSNPALRLVYQLARRQFGKVIAPLRVIYARKPRLLPLATLMSRTLERGLSLDPELRLLVQVQVARGNSCAFCEDLALSQAVRRRLGAERFDALPDFRTSTAFSVGERAALAFAAEAASGSGVSDQTFDLAQHHFSEVELIELAWVVAAETYFNIQARAFRLGSDGLAQLASRR